MLTSRLIQADPCPKCGHKAGWRQYMPGVPIEVRANGMIAYQPASPSTAGEKKTCAKEGCGAEISATVRQVH